MIDYNQLIYKYYAAQPLLHHLLLRHSRCVADKALEIAHRHPEWGADVGFLEEAAMLHDIGIYTTYAPTIHCYGDAPYITHGIAGNHLLLLHHLPNHARVCERHTGAGISTAQIVAQQLPLPHRDMLPESIEEQIICYADKFYSKSTPDEEFSIGQIIQSLSKFGQDSVRRFEQWHQQFSV